MFFSVVIPVYNVENYLEECIQSVLNQTFRDFEIILIDDGSTDNSPVICDYYAKQYPDLINTYHKENEGLLLTRRKGFALSEGEYILSLDSDDMLRSDTIEILYNEIKRSNPDVIVFDFSCDKEYKTKRNNLGFMPGQFIDKNEIYKLINTDASFNNMANKCIKRELINLDYDYSKYKFVSNGEDLLQLLPIIDNAERFIYINENLYYYRTNENSITHSFSENYFRSVSTVGYELCKYMEKWSVNKKFVYTRNMRTCVGVFIYIFNANIKINQKCKHIKEIAKSNFFKTSYKNCDLSLLPIKERIIADILLLFSI